MHQKHLRTKVRIRENALIAKLAARRLGTARVAIVIGKTIYLHNTSATELTSNMRWLLHELKHVAQYQQYGYITFMGLYFIEYLKKGYYANKYEVAARAAENDLTLLSHYEITT